MGYDTGIANRLRAKGLKVVEVAGWQTRGSGSFNPRGFVWHHTAGPKSGNAPSLTICTHGRPGLAGPLCNVFQARDNTIYVVAAGRANHAGTGGWKDLSGNSSVFGLEIENTGTGSEPWREDQLDTAARVAAALLNNPNMSCHHKEWTKRKIDMHTVGGDAMRLRTKGHSGGNWNPDPKPQPNPGRPTPPPNQSEEDDEMGSYLQSSEKDGTIWHILGETYRKVSTAQYEQRRNLARLGGKDIPLTAIHPWGAAKFVLDFKLIELKPDA